MYKRQVLEMVTPGHVLLPTDIFQELQVWPVALHKPCEQIKYVEPQDESKCCYCFTIIFLSVHCFTLILTVDIES